MRAAILICVSMAWTTMAAAQPLSVQTGDGVALAVDGSGAVTSLRIGGTELLGAPGGFALCDYAKQPEPVNLIPNGGFEEGAQGWSLGAGQTIDEDIAHSGRRSVRLSIPAGEPGRSNVGVTV
ncbi:MAG: hypothetical protein AB7Y46_13160, partial [Armatimonadota bacterium]